MRFERPHFRNRYAGPARDAAHVRQNEPPDDDAEEGARREAEYLRRLTEEKVPVEVHLVTGESFRGFIEYYDRRFIRLTRERARNLFIFKQDIKYLREG